MLRLSVWRAYLDRLSSEPGQYKVKKFQPMPGFESALSITQAQCPL